MDDSLAIIDQCPPPVKTPCQPDDYIELGLPAPTITTQKYFNLCSYAAELLSNGNDLKGVAAACGLHRNTLHYWTTTGHFQALIDLKKQERRERLLSKVYKHTDKNWFAAAWLLERNRAFEGEFAQPRAQAGSSGNIQINIAVGGVPVNQEGITVEVGTKACEDEK